MILKTQKGLFFALLCVLVSSAATGGDGHGWIDGVVEFVDIVQNEKRHLRGPWLRGMEAGSAKITGTFLLLVQSTVRVTVSSRLCESPDRERISLSPWVMFSSTQPLDSTVTTRSSCLPNILWVKLFVMIENSPEMWTGIVFDRLKYRGTTSTYVRSLLFWREIPLR